MYLIFKLCNRTEKSYGKNQVLKNISFELNQGEKVALLGNNGAGKSTLMNIINGNLEASSGQIDYGTMNLTSNNTGYIMQNMTLPPDALGNEVLSLFARDENAKNYGRRLVKEFRMESFLNRRFSNLSGGQKQKLFLISALQNSPEYFFLDEITTGLDSESRVELFKFLTSNLKVKEATLLLVTHYLEEALQLCDRFIILKEGQIIADLKNSDLIQEDFSYLECSMNISDFEEYRIKEYQYKIPKKLAAEALVRFSKEIVLYQKDYRIDLEELLS
ncbi:ABC transporter ATP binding protein [Lactococcus cremoris subsp. cremoris UC509.9]|uniref:ABC transporter ATP-binding protein n=2 Tax=Lactococcus lactis subsp. cremoris TaxID=1359 RepID=UPI00029B6CB5|nr:ABC transporter ATP binding protein [Lactococcus cremoris subsp. cremoris UC509.9]QRZ29324.1 ABC transporter ATP binding protein [Lactococcus cremoris]